MKQHCLQRNIYPLYHYHPIEILNKWWQRFPFKTRFCTKHVNWLLAMDNLVDNRIKLISGSFEKVLLWIFSNELLKARMWFPNKRLINTHSFNANRRHFVMVRNLCPFCIKKIAIERKCPNEISDFSLYHVCFYW